MDTPGITYENLTECPYCRGRDIVSLFSAPDRLTHLPGEFFLSKCNACKLVFQNPRIPEADIKNYYVDELGYYQTDTAEKQPGKKDKLFKFLKEATLANHFGYLFPKRNLALKFLTYPLKREFHILGYPEFKKEGRLLEIGCATGRFLARLKKAGWTVDGVEFHRPSAEHASRELGIEVKVGKIEEIDLGAKRFDAVIMHMVLEHLYSPFETLKQITTALKDDGELIFSIPYFEGFEYRWFKNYTYGLHLPAHIFFFNRNILKEYLTRLGYSDVRFYHQFFDRDVVASANFKHKETGNRFYKIIATNRILRIAVIKPLMVLLSLINVTGRVTVCAKKAATSDKTATAKPPVQ